MRVASYLVAVFLQRMDIRLILNALLDIALQLVFREPAVTWLLVKFHVFSYFPVQGTGILNCRSHASPLRYICASVPDASHDARELETHYAQAGYFSCPYHYIAYLTTSDVTDELSIFAQVSELPIPLYCS